MMNIEYSVTDEHGIDIIAPLWKKLNEHHGRLSPHFGYDYSGRTWEKRKIEFVGEAADLRVDLAKDNDTGDLVGYCVSSITTDRLGEIDSIFVESEYRQCGIGNHLITNALNWMGELSVTRVIVQVLVGNEESYPFYGRYGFLPRTTVMMRIDENDTSGS
ncbi:MAG: GNAT family N-acetyltransferase [Dehalococcoidales bacterium]|nr:MAG: GNAT family N-acetyltransferase [Dehalococcoidales bacterium]